MSSKSNYYDNKISKINDNMSTLSGLPSKVIPKIFEYLSLVLSHELMECLIKDDDKLSFIIPEVGEIEVIIDVNDNISYNFIPTKSFNKKVESVVIDSTDPLLVTSMDKLKKHIINKYNEQL